MLSSSGLLRSGDGKHYARRICWQLVAVPSAWYRPILFLGCFKSHRWGLGRIRRNWLWPFQVLDGSADSIQIDRLMVIREEAVVRRNAYWKDRLMDGWMPNERIRWLLQALVYGRIGDDALQRWIWFNTFQWRIGGRGSWNWILCRCYHVVTWRGLDYGLFGNRGAFAAVIDVYLVVVRILRKEGLQARTIVGK